MARDDRERPPMYPEGALLRQARRHRRPRMSTVEAAKRADIGPSWWQQIEKGYRPIEGQRIPVQATPETLARMADALDITPEELTQVDRDDAAAALRQYRNSTRDISRYLQRVLTEVNLDADDPLTARILASDLLFDEDREELLRRRRRQLDELNEAIELYEIRRSR